jgi:hypothetical protein
MLALRMYEMECLASSFARYAPLSASIETINRSNFPTLVRAEAAVHNSRFPSGPVNMRCENPRGPHKSLRMESLSGSLVLR